MRLGTSITLITVGAILVFAVRAEPWIISFNAVGLILAAVGGAGILINHTVWERRKEAARMRFDADGRTHYRDSETVPGTGRRTGDGAGGHAGRAGNAADSHLGYGADYQPEARADLEDIDPPAAGTPGSNRGWYPYPRVPD